MFVGKILSGIWEEETIILKGMPKNFVLSARNLIVLETDEYKQQNKELERHRWIPVSKRLPSLEDACSGQGERGCRDGTVDVIGVDVNGHVFGANYFPKMDVWNFGTEPTHWKPIVLPEQTLKETNG